jgi:hypothetical protein
MSDHIPARVLLAKELEIFERLRAGLLNTAPGKFAPIRE